MKKIYEKFVAQKLSKMEMRQIKGGEVKVTCVVDVSVSCGGGVYTFDCTGDPDDCQNEADFICYENDCCNEIDCA